MYNALCKDKGAEGNYVLPYYYPIYYDYYSTTLNTVYCLVDTGGATGGAPSRRYSPEPPLAPDKITQCDPVPSGHIYVIISNRRSRSLVFSMVLSVI